MSQLLRVSLFQKLPVGVKATPLSVIVQQWSGDDPVVNRLARPFINRSLYPSLNEDDEWEENLRAVISAELEKKHPLNVGDPGNSSGGIFACRHCYQLAYPSQRETCDDRAARRVDRIRERLGWEPGILNGNGWKPKGMHWNTFERRRDPARWRRTGKHEAALQPF